MSHRKMNNAHRNLMKTLNANSPMQRNACEKNRGCQSGTHARAVLPVQKHTEDMKNAYRSVWTNDAVATTSTDRCCCWYFTLLFFFFLLLRAIRCDIPPYFTVNMLLFSPHSYIRCVFASMNGGGWSLVDPQCVEVCVRTVGRG